MQPCNTNKKGRNLSGINIIVGAAILKKMNGQGIKLRWLADICSHPNNLGRQLRDGNIHQTLLIRISDALNTDFSIIYSLCFLYLKNPNNVTPDEREGVYFLDKLLNDVEKVNELTDEQDGELYLDKLLGYLDKLSENPPTV